jgi:hypothetical protein
MEAIANHLRTLPATNVAARLDQLRLRIAGRLEQGLSSSSMRYGLCRDLNVPLERPIAKIPLAIRPLLESDVPSLLSLENAQGDSRDKLESRGDELSSRKRAQQAVSWRLICGLTLPAICSG